MSRKKKSANQPDPLSTSEILRLQDGLRPGSGQDEKDDAKKIIEKKFGGVLVSKKQFVALSAAAKKGRKRGPKPAAKTNKTDKREAMILEAIRLTLGKSARGLTKPEMLQVILELARFLKTKRESGLFLDMEQRSSLYRLTAQRRTIALNLARKHRDGDLSLGSVDTILPTFINIHRSLCELEKTVWQGAVKQSWQSLVARTIKSVKTAKNENASESRIYRQLRRVLGLELTAIEALDLDKAFFTVQPAKGAHRAKARRESTKRSRYRDVYPHAAVPRTLETTQENLILLRRLVEQCSYCTVGVAVERLYVLVHTWGYFNHPDALPREVAELETIFLRAASAQRRSPFPSISNEEISFGPPDTWADQDKRYSLINDSERLSKKSELA